MQLEADLALAIAIFEPFLAPGNVLDPSVLHQTVFALRHFTHQRPHNAGAAHLYALICERLGLAEEAVLSLERATELLEQDFESTESSEVEERYIVALVNLGRIRLSVQAYPASVDAFTNALELVSGTQHPQSGQMKVQCRLGQGLAFSSLGKVDEAVEAFQGALDECSDEQEKEVVAVLLARTLWAMEGDDAKDLAKSQLMEW